MKYYYIQRWTASDVKLEGKTIRESPSEHTWEFVVVNKDDVQWFRLSDNVMKEDAFGVKISVDAETAKDFLSQLKLNKTIVINPGSFPNDRKDTKLFMRLAETGTAKQLEEDKVLRYLLRNNQIVLTPRRGVEDQYRVSVSSGPGGDLIDTFAMSDYKIQIIEDKDNPDVVTLKNVPIAKAGVWNGIQITKNILNGLKARFEKLKDKLFVPLKLEHSGVKESDEYTRHGPALGWLARIYYDPKLEALFGDFIKVPKAVARLIKNGQYISVSPEIARDFEGTPDVLVGVALLGAALPAMTSLPKLINVLYAEKEGLDTFSLNIPASEFGGVMAEEIKVQTDEPVFSVIKKLLFQRAATENDPDIIRAVEQLKLKKYPKKLAEEMVELLPDVSEDKINLITEYTVQMISDRVNVLADRAKFPEKCEAVIEEIEETKQIFADELEKPENAELAKKLDEVLKTAQENKGTVELEEAVEKEKPIDTNRQLVPPEEIPKEERYPKLEEYPTVPKNVTIDLQKLESELKRRALGLVKATVEKFQANGWTPIQCSRLEELLIQLDPALTPQIETERVRTLLFQLIDDAPRQLKTFQQIVDPQEVEDKSDFVETLISSSKRARARR